MAPLLREPVSAKPKGGGRVDEMCYFGKSYSLPGTAGSFMELGEIADSEVGKSLYTLP